MEGHPMTAPTVSYSEVAAGRQCLHMWYYGYVQRIRNTKPGPALEILSLIHI